VGGIPGPFAKARVDPVAITNNVAKKILIITLFIFFPLQIFRLPGMSKPLTGKRIAGLAQEPQEFAVGGIFRKFWEFGAGI
jgi:hypothetical protein